MKNISVLELITGMDIGGAEVVLLNLCKNLDKSRFNIYTFGLDSTTNLLEEFKQASTLAMSLGMQKTPLSMLKTVKMIKSFIREKDINIIHAHLFHTLPIAVLVKFLNPSIKILFTPHSAHNGGRGDGKVEDQIVKLLKSFRSVDILFSESMKRDIYLDNAIVIENGVEVDKYHISTNKNSKFTYIHVARFRDEKNQAFLVKNVKQLVEKGLDFELWFVGDGELEDELKKETQKRGLQKYIKFLGLRDDIPNILNQVNVFLLPSKVEGLPISALEAGACKLPIISTPVGTLPELLSDGCGYIEELDSFIDRMEWVYHNYDQAKECGEKLYEKIVDEYSIKSMAKKHEELYLSLL